MDPKPKTILTRRICLKQISDTDADRIMKILFNQKIKETYMLPDFSSADEAEKMFFRLKELSSDPDRFFYGIYYEDTLIGFINDVGIHNETIELGYVIHPDHQNCGYASEALSATIRELFRMGYSCIKAGYFEGNEASRRVMEKCGMSETGETEDIEYHGKTQRCIYHAISKRAKENEKDCS